MGPRWVYVAGVHFVYRTCIIKIHIQMMEGWSLHWSDQDYRKFKEEKICFQLLNICIFHLYIYIASCNRKHVLGREMFDVECWLWNVNLFDAIFYLMCAQTVLWWDVWCCLSICDSKRICHALGVDMYTGCTVSLVYQIWTSVCQEGIRTNTMSYIILMHHWKLQDQNSKEL